MPMMTPPGDRDEIQRPRAARAWTAGLALLCVAALLLMVRHIDRTLPYPYHADEGYVSGPASNILRTGSLHPYKFNYPSLPAYLAAAGMAAGFVRSAAHQEITDLDSIGHVGYPYYETPRVMQTARRLYAVLAVMCLATTGWASWLAFRRPSTIVLAPLLLLLSPLFFRHAWTYLNVDIVGTAFVTLTLAACLLGTTRPSLYQSALVPGLFAGLAVASKYTLAIVALPVLLAVALYGPRGRTMSAFAVVIGAMAVAFVAAVPYSLIDLRGFLNGVAFEAHHYASGHSGFSGDPGLEQLVFYARHFMSDFGFVAAALAAVGVALSLWTDWRRGVVLIAFPAALLSLLAIQRVHFTRNVLPMHPFVAMFAAFALVWVHERIAAAAVRRGWTIRKIGVPAAVGAVLFVASVPVWRVPDYLRDRTDSRNRARSWIAERLPPQWAIVVPKELGFDLRPLASGGRHVKEVELRAAADPETLAARLSDVPAPAAILVPRWGADRRTPGQREADTLNALGREWRVLSTFGTTDVLVNYSFATAWGDPAFAIAVLK
jgi:hypothetical protein